MGNESVTSTRSSAQGRLGTRVSAAAHPVGGSTINTDTEGLITGEIKAKSSGFDVPVYYAKPSASAELLPVVLVGSEVFGVHAHIADVCRRFAKLGYLAMAPDLFARLGDASSFETLEDLIKKVISRTPDAQVIADLDAVQARASELGGDTGRLGVTGFCWGGRITWLYAAHAPNVKAAAAWYGRLDGDVSVSTPVHPVSVAAHLRAPVLGLYAGNDPVVPKEHVSSMRAALARGNEYARTSHIKIYPEAAHAFFADYRGSYRADDARDGWQRCIEWFREHGVA